MVTLSGETSRICPVSRTWRRRVGQADGADQLGRVGRMLAGCAIRDSSACLSPFRSTRRYFRASVAVLDAGDGAGSPVKCWRDVHRYGLAFDNVERDETGAALGRPFVSGLKARAALAEAVAGRHTDREEAIVVVHVRVARQTGPVAHWLEGQHAATRSAATLALCAGISPTTICCRPIPVQGRLIQRRRAGCKMGCRRSWTDATFS